MNQKPFTKDNIKIHLFKMQTCRKPVRCKFQSMAYRMKDEMKQGEKLLRRHPDAAELLADRDARFRSRPERGRDGADPPGPGEHDLRVEVIRFQGPGQVGEVFSHLDFRVFSSCHDQYWIFPGYK